MTTIDSLNRSITLMTLQETFNLIKKSRLRRRTPIKKLTKKTSEKDPFTLLEKLTSDQKKQLGKILLAKMGEIKLRGQ